MSSERESKNPMQAVAGQLRELFQLKATGVQEGHPDVKALIRKLRASFGEAEANPITYEALRKLLMDGGMTARMYEGLRKAVVAEVLEEGKDGAATRQKKLQVAWFRLFRADAPAKLETLNAQVGRQTGGATVSKVTVHLPKYDGAHGHAGVWWTRHATCLIALCQRPIPTGRNIGFLSYTTS
jgi:hypothetical protein